MRTKTDIIGICPQKRPFSGTKSQKGTIKKATRKSSEWPGIAGHRVEETYPKYSLISDYKAMRPYIDIAEKTKADAMKLIDDAWGM